MGITNGQPSYNPVPKGESRLQIKTGLDQEDENAEQKWKRAVREKDDHRCRWCGRRVVVTIALIPERAECHHLVRRDDKRVRWDIRNGLLLCLACHERVTGKVNEKFIVVASVLYVVDEIEYPNAREAVEFKRIA